MKPSVPRGTRDFGPAEMQKRNYILNVVRKNFELFGYQPIETPAMENISTLTGKYGEEGDQLIFKILNSRIHESSRKEELKKEFALSLEASRNSDIITEKALRYDLTVPFARFVVMNQHNLVFPFRRYQIQPVWRADKPQKGRYREFYQCDADVIGSNSLVNELELISLMDKTFGELNLPVIIKFNNRKILSALAKVIGHPDKIVPITVAIDKLDKIGQDGVEKELCGSGLDNEAVLKLRPVLVFKGDNNDKAEALRRIVGSDEEGLKGIEEIMYLLNHASVKHSMLELDITLARGLNYYTGTIFEVKARAGNFTPSILGGGRYDDLTGVFGLSNMSGVGISFGIDRIYDVLEELKKYPESISKTSLTRVLFVHFDEESRAHCLKLAAFLREKNINCEVYPEIKKTGKQMEYADKKQIPFVCIVGSNEMKSEKYALKNMESGGQQQLSAEELAQFILNQ